MNTRTIALTRALALLRSAGCKFIVIDEAGTEHSEGGLRLAPEENGTKRRRAEHREHGALVAYYRPLLENAAVGDVKTIPLGPFKGEREALRKAITGWCCAHWGNGAAITSTSDDAIEVLRVS